MTTSDACGDTCPRCGAAFHCGVHDDAPCACTTLRLDDALLMRLRVRFSGCLCLRCLSALAGGEPLDPCALAPPVKR